MGEEEEADKEEEEEEEEEGDAEAVPLGSCSRLLPGFRAKLTWWPASISAVRRRLSLGLPSS